MKRPGCGRIGCLAVIGLVAFLAVMTVMAAFNMVQTMNLGGHNPPPSVAPPTLVMTPSAQAGPSPTALPAAANDANLNGQIVVQTGLPPAVGRTPTLIPTALGYFDRLTATVTAGQGQWNATMTAWFGFETLSARTNPTAVPAVIGSK